MGLLLRFPKFGWHYADGTDADYAEVNAAQKEFRLVPLSAYGTVYMPPPRAR
ncbi:hypothetical protein [Paraburkholderia fungorum]|uniref:hypothetical protein n=1 Tax=Paraburkholderia fungorum TaxID=134537 RepID=UPI0038B76739